MGFEEPLTYSQSDHNYTLSDLYQAVIGIIIPDKTNQQKQALNFKKEYGMALKEIMLRLFGSFGSTLQKWSENMSEYLHDHLGQLQQTYMEGEVDKYLQVAVIQKQFYEYMRQIEMISGKQIEQLSLVKPIEQFVRKTEKSKSTKLRKPSMSSLNIKKGRSLSQKTKNRSSSISQKQYHPKISMFDSGSLHQPAFTSTLSNFSKTTQSFTLTNPSTNYYELKKKPETKKHKLQEKPKFMTCKFQHVTTETRKDTVFDQQIQQNSFVTTEEYQKRYQEIQVKIDTKMDRLQTNLDQKFTILLQQMKKKNVSKEPQQPQYRVELEYKQKEGQYKPNQSQKQPHHKPQQPQYKAELESKQKEEQYKPNQKSKAGPKVEQSIPEETDDDSVQKTEQKQRVKNKKLISQSKQKNKIVKNQIQNDNLQETSGDKENFGQTTPDTKQIDSWKNQILDLYKISKTVKFPVNQSLLEILASFVKSSNLPAFESIKEQIKQYKLEIGLHNDQKQRAELKSILMKLAKFYNGQIPPQKLTKIKAYITQTIKCTYMIVLKQSYNGREELKISLNHLIQML